MAHDKVHACLIEVVCELGICEGSEAPDDDVGIRWQIALEMSNYHASGQEILWVILCISFWWDTQSLIGVKANDMKVALP
jgi:hypothetical protein